MKRLFACALLLASCGPARHSEKAYPRYAVLTSLEPASPMYRSVEWLARRRYATVVNFTRIDRDASALLSRLRALQPSYVAVVLRPEELDVNFQFSLFEISCRLDPDPFPDFAWGYFLATDPAFLERQMNSLRGAEAKIEPRLLRLTHLEAGAEASGISQVDLEWASRLPCRLLSVKAGDMAFFRKHRADVEQADFLILEGEGSAEGLRHLPPEEVRTLRLDSTAVFSGADYTGASGAVFENSAGLATRRPVPSDRSFAQAILRAGPAAFFAPLDRTPPSLAAFEWAGAILYDAPLGEAIKRNYDLAILSSGYGTPTLERLVDGRTAPTGNDHPAVQAVMRVLYGDPVLQPFVRTTTPPVRQEAVTDSLNSRGDRVRRFRWRVDAADCAPFFTDPFTDAERIHLRVPCPAGTVAATALLRGCTHEGQEVPSILAEQALEQWRDETFLHVLVHGQGLARKGLQVTVDVILK